MIYINICAKTSGNRIETLGKLQLTGREKKFLNEEKLQIKKYMKVTHVSKYLQLSLFCIHFFSSQKKSASIASSIKGNPSHYRKNVIATFSH